MADANTLGLHKSVFKVSGFDCADCAAKLEKKIAGITGVHQANVNFGASKLTVEHSLTDDQIIIVIEQSGYQGWLDDGRQPQTAASAWWKNPRLMATIISGGLLTVVSLLDWVGFDHDWVIALYLLTAVIGGYHTARSAYYSLRSLSMDMNFLMTIAVIGAAFIGEWSEAATVVVLFSLGNTLQAYTLDKTRESIKALIELTPREALVRRQNIEQQLPIEDIRIGDVIIVKPGERIAMDGGVIQGVSTVNQAAITGESMPIEKTVGDIVYAGSINEVGSLEIVVTKLAADSTIAKILKLVEEAQAQKAPSQQFVDKFAAYYTPVIIVSAVVIALIPWLMFEQNFQAWLYRALVLLVIACPCALVISTPVSIVSAIGNASRRGVLIKGGAYLEEIGQLKAIAFDKTGTLTNGRPEVTDVVAAAPYTTEQLLSAAGAIERLSEHPIAQAIFEKARGLTLPSTSNFKAVLGKGVQADIQGQTVYIGNYRLFSEMNEQFAAYQDQVLALESQGKTVMLVGSVSEIYGMIAVADTLRPNSVAAVQALKASGVQELIILTGDNEQVARNIAGQLGIDRYYGELLPQDKVALIKEFGEKYGGVAMVGDGVNDAPALAVANVGIAMGVQGSDVALETADVALMSDDLSKVSYLMQLSRKTLAIIKQNIALSIVIKAIFIMITMAGAANLWLAVIADMGTSLVVTLNGMRLAREIKQR
ncbi:copper-translocating P-type ATPase [Sporomusaceae bacterium FL31]|nr:copper-translocating P-type ATPase [Sporomusaceae bacterium FL31]GCE34736.1 copper-translocating P-type ATPase [Sporomusaceae bacterium]